MRWLRNERYKWYQEAHVPLSCREWRFIGLLLGLCLAGGLIVAYCL